jgi:hypothetical protein
VVAGQTFQVRPPLNVNWGQPNQGCNALLPQSLSSGSLQVLLADGSVRGINPSIGAPTWNGALTPSNGEVLSEW